MSTTLPTTQQQAIEALRARAYSDPSPAEVAAMQQKMDAEMLAAHGEGWNQRTTPSEAERALRLQWSAEYKEASNAKAWAEVRASKEQSRTAEPKASQSEWAAKYEKVLNEDYSVSYVRGGEEKIRDNGDGIQVVGTDKDTIRDSVRLARERFGNEICVNVKDETKRDAILEEMARQGVKPQEALLERYAEIKAEVEKQRSEAQLSRTKEPEKSQQNEQEHEMEM